MMMIMMMMSDGYSYKASCARPG